MSAQFVRFRLVGEGAGVAQTVREDGSPHVIQTDAHSSFGGGDTAPSPLAYALAALTSCTQVTSQIVARDLGLSLGRFNVSVDAKLDPTVLATGAEGAPEVFQRFSQEVERRCPVTQLFRRSGVVVTTVWIARNLAEAGVAAE